MNRTGSSADGAVRYNAPPQPASLALTALPLSVIAPPSRSGSYAVSIAAPGANRSRCGAQQDTLAALGEQYGDKVAFVGFAGKDTKEKLRPWLADHKVSYPVGIDPDLKKWRQYAVETPPAVVLVAPGGKLLRGWTGGVEREVLEDELAALVRD